MTLEIAWYGVLGLSMLMYALLDGFDLGVGMLHLFAKEDEDRRIFLRAIGPVWDGNEVWIVIIMGGLFAGFPNAYATLFSGFYTLLMLLIASLIFRAVSIEFRSKMVSMRWRRFWDGIFAFSSLITACAIGLVFGNLIEGVPIDAAQDCSCSLELFFRPYPLLIAGLVALLFALHGALYLYLKTEGRPQEIVFKLIRPLAIASLFLFLCMSAVTLFHLPRIAQPIFNRPILGVAPLMAILSLVAIICLIGRRRGGWAFISSCAAIASLLWLFQIGTFPLILYSTVNPDAYSLTIYNTGSSEATLKILLSIVAMGIPLVLGYCWWIYRIFWGKISSAR